MYILLYGMLTMLFASRGVVAPGPGQLTPQSGHINRLVRAKLVPAFVQLAHFGRNNGVVNAHELISDPTLLDKIYDLPNGAVEACLDDILHGDESIHIEVATDAKDFITLDNAPSTCLTIVTEVVRRDEYKDYKPEDMMVSLVGGRNKAVRINGFDEFQVEMLREMAAEVHDGADTSLDVRIV